MKQTINKNDFIDAFKRIRPNSFSDWALGELFDYLERYEEDTGEEMELDVIAIDCDFYESTFDEVRQNYTDSAEMDNDELIEYLNENTSVVAYDDESVIFQGF